MNKHLFSSLVVFLCMFVFVSSCNQNDAEPELTIDSYIQKHKAKRMSVAQSDSILKTGNFLNFDSVEEADEYLNKIEAIGKKGGTFRSNSSSKQQRNSIFSNGGSVSIDLGSRDNLSDLSNTVSARMMYEGDNENSLVVNRNFGWESNLRIIVSWEGNYSGLTSTASLQSIANYNTWTTEQSVSSYNPSTKEISFTIYGAVNVNVFVQGIGTIQTYQGNITGTIDTVSGQSAINWKF